MSPHWAQGPIDSAFVRNKMRQGWQLQPTLGDPTQFVLTIDDRGRKLGVLVPAATIQQMLDAHVIARCDQTFYLEEDFL